MSLKIVENILYNNDCYKSGRKIVPVAMQLHTIGTAQNSASALASYWNQSGVEACVHYCVDAEHEDLVLHFLPENIRSWADCGAGNSMAITVELMESDYMKYTGNGASYVITDEAKFKADVTRAYKTAVKFFATKCKEYGWNPQEKMSNGLYRVFSHDEGRRLGLSSAHVDPTHIWDRYGWSMDKFRADVAKAMKEGVESVKIDAISSAAASISWYRVRKTWADEKSQLGAYADLGNARKNCPAGYKVFDSKGNVVYEHAGEKDLKEAVANPAGIPKSKEAYIEAVGKICHDIMEETGVLASVVAAQCCLETGFGLGNDSTALVKVNNLLGVKADLINNTWKEYTTWDGTTIIKKTPEYRNGKLIYIDDKFRAYSDYQECIYDYVMFLLHVQNGQGYKYRRLKGVTDPAKVIHIIYTGTGTSEDPEGYCTDPNYESKILKLIKDYNLDRFNVATITGDQVDGKERSEMAVKEIEYYRVAKDYKDGKYISQMGAYVSKESAIKACEAVGSEFKVYDPNGKVVYPVSTAQYRVQAGIFKSKENAEKLVAEMKKAGFDALITEEKE